MPSSTQRARFWRRPDDVDGHDFVADPVCFEAYLLRAGPGRSEARLTDSMWSRLGGSQTQERDPRSGTPGGRRELEQGLSWRLESSNCT
jgi:hypothetical protein